MRFLPNRSFSSPVDVAFSAGGIRIMTYLESRHETKIVSDNRAMVNDGTKALKEKKVEEFSLELFFDNGAISGISKVGLTLASAFAL